MRPRRPTRPATRCRNCRRHRTQSRPALVRRAPRLRRAAAEPAPEEPTEGALPSIDLLDAPEPKDPFRMELKLSQLGEVLVEKLRSFGVQSRIGGRTTGPVVTQFEVVPAPGVKVNRIANLEADLALAMKARSIRIVAPIPGKGAVGVEIPNPEPEIVYLRDILESPAFRSSKAALPLALGKDLTGRPYVSDLARMPHVLIAGATGSGKSVCLNAFITSLVYSHSPESLRLLMVDPKMVELSVYADLPHLRHPVVTDPSDAASVLKWAVMEMERRYGPALGEPGALAGGVQPDGARRTAPAPSAATARPRRRTRGRSLGGGHPPLRGGHHRRACRSDDDGSG